MDLKVDFAFKQLFGSDKNKEITIVFLNAILQQTNRGIIKSIQFENVEIIGEHREDKVKLQSVGALSPLIVS